MRGQSTWNPHVSLSGGKIIQPLWRTFWNFLIKLNMDLFYGLAISFPGYPREVKIHVYTRDLFENIYSSFIHNHQITRKETNVHQLMGR